MKANKNTTKAIGLLEEAIQILGDEKSALENTYEDKSEKWQEGEKGQRMQEDIDNFDSAITDLENGLQYVQDLIEE